METLRLKWVTIEKMTKNQDYLPFGNVLCWSVFLKLGEMYPSALLNIKQVRHVGKKRLREQCE